MCGNRLAIRGSMLWRVRSLVYNNGECKSMFLRLMLMSHSNQPLLLVVSIVLVASIVLLLLDPLGLLLFHGITKSRIILFNIIDDSPT